MKGLEAFEEIKRVMNKLFGGVECCDKALNTIEKELKALEIIIKYDVRPSDLHYYTTYNIYLCYTSFIEKAEIMCEEEYDLLKEVLL